MSLIEAHWYQTRYTWLTILLLPLSWLFRCVVALRYFLYHIHFKKSYSGAKPVIVVGNITVGGTGKTPFVIWLVGQLQSKGWRPAIVSRGIGGIQQNQPVWVTKQSDPKVVGDEAVLMVSRTNCPLVIAIDRVAAVNEVLAKTDCNIVVSDDGLQHYRLRRDMEIVIVDHVRLFGNKQLLPAGPLREPVARLKRADIIVQNGSDDMLLVGNALVALHNVALRCKASELQSQTVHAVAGIGNPSRFFATLRAMGLTVIEHVFPDHFQYQSSDIHFSDNLPVIMTEKDAVKCFAFANQQHWYLPVDAVINPELTNQILKKVEAQCVR